MQTPRKIEACEALARNMVGDGKSPNLFFVSIGGTNVMITRDFNAAYHAWRAIPRHIESALEDRKWGTVCSNEPEEDGSSKLVVTDDSRSFMKRHRIAE